MTFTLTGNNTATLVWILILSQALLLSLQQAATTNHLSLEFTMMPLLRQMRLLNYRLLSQRMVTPLHRLPRIYTLTIYEFVASNILFEDFESGGLGSFTTKDNPGSDNFQNGTTNTASSQFWIIEPTNDTQFAYSNDDACDCDKSNDRLTSPVFSLAATQQMFSWNLTMLPAYTSETAEVQINTGMVGTPFRR